MPNPLDRKVEGGSLTPVYIAGGENGSLEGTFPAVVQTASATLDQMQSDYTERITGGVRVIATDHAVVHDGKAYEITVAWEAVPAGESRYIGFLTNGTQYSHLKSFTLWTNQSVAIARLWRNPDSLVGGAATIPVNQNDVAAVPPVSMDAVVVDPTVTIGSAFLMRTIYFGGGGSGPHGTSGGETGLDREIVLRQNAQYVWQLTNASGSAAILAFTAFWYELGGV